MPAADWGIPILTATSRTTPTKPQQRKAKGTEALPGNLNLSGAPFAFEHTKKNTDGATKGKPINYLHQTGSLTISGHTLKCGILLTPDSPIHREVKTLVDTGSLTLNYVSPTVASWLTSKGAHTARAKGDNRRMVCSVHQCTLVDTIVTFKLVVYFNETTFTNETINIEA